MSSALLSSTAQARGASCCNIARRETAGASRCANAGRIVSRQLEWRQASGRGSLYTFTIMHQVMNPGFASAVPYNVAQVDLTEGVWMTSNVVGVANDALLIGIPLQAVFEDAGENVRIPKFRPVAG